MKEGWRQRLLESTRGRVLALVRGSERTVNELANALGLTDNAVRLHLSALERDGLVEQHGTRREWTGKPAFVYRTTAAAESLFPKAHEVVLAELLSLLEEQNSTVDVEQLMMQVGRRLTVKGALDAQPLEQRVQQAAAVLTELGGLAEVQADSDGFLLRGHSCPLGVLTREHPMTCRIAEALVAELVGTAVTECCDRGDRPRCAFRIAAA